MNAYEEQLKLEETMVGLGQDRYLKKMTTSEESELPPGVIILRQMVAPVTDALTEWAEGMLAGNPGKGAACVKTIRDAGYAECSFIALRACINGITGQQKYGAVAVDISKSIQKMIDFRDFQKFDAKAAYFLDKDLEGKGNTRHRAAIISKRRHDAEHVDTRWASTLEYQVGSRLIETIIETTGFFVHENQQVGAHKTEKYLVATQDVMDWLRKQHQKCALLQPFTMPMLVSPVDWTTSYDGGYLGIRNTLLKTDNKKQLDLIEQSAGSMSTVYTAVNKLQATGWRINHRVYKVMQALWEIGGDRAGLPPRDGKLVPNRPFDIDENEVAMKQWKKEATLVHDYNHRATGKVMVIGQKLMIADKFIKKIFYFPYSLDWRGRAYPIGTALNPQGDDSAKALLEFAVGKPLGTEQAVHWLYIHIANTFGFDKAGYEDRIEWVEAHASEIYDYGTYPLDNQGWTDAADPFSFLAACYEFVGYMHNGLDHVSHLPIQVDGTCNGLQHYSAMLRDSIGGAATNLVPADKPADIYTQVANKANKYLSEQALLGVEGAAELAGTINRRLAKRNTMTVPYAVSRYGMTDQIKGEFKKMRDEGCMIDLQGLTDAQSVKLIVEANCHAINETVVAASAAMAFLKSVARVASEGITELRWITPAGLPILQKYQDRGTKCVDITVNGKRLQFKTAGDKDSLDKRGQTSAIAPNFIHSLDAAHLQSTIVKAAAEGINSFCFIHDSYGTHAADMPLLAIILREVFVEQYSIDVLTEFRDGIVEQLVTAGYPKIAAKLPPVPTQGTLDLQGILESQYFFA